MSLLNNSLLLGADAGGGGYAISRSVRFNSSDSAYLSRTPASAGNRKTWTWAGWVKRSGLGTRQFLFSAQNNASLYNTDDFFFTSGDALTFWNNGDTEGTLTTSQVFRDASAWYHIVFAYDSTQATAANRMKMYVNGVQITTFSTSTYPTQNRDSAINSTRLHQIARRSDNSEGASFNGYLADCFLIDGQALDPTSFGEFSATTGVWMPKAYSGGSYGTNGFHLDFADNSTAAALGTDTSGNGNTWTVNNISVTAGAGNDSLVDVPTNGSEVDTGSGGQVRGNYAVWNPLAKGSDCTLSNGNLDVAWGTAGSTTQGSATFGMSSGKWYWETTITASSASPTNAVLGITTKPFGDSEYPGYTATSWGYRGSDGQKWNNTSGASYGASYANGDVVGVAFDADNGTLTFYKNGSSQGTAFTGLTSGPYFPAIGDQSSSQTFSAATNFGQRPFAYTAPSGFKALCTANLPAPVVTKPNTVMDVKLYTGNGSTQTISGLGFSPDFVWLKRRDTAQDNNSYDSVRGSSGGYVKQLLSNTTSADSPYGDGVYGGLTAFNSDGFTLSSSNSDYRLTNASGSPYAGWCWDAGSSTVTNTAGSISSQVRTNNYLSIVAYTGTGANATIGHGLGTAPSFIIVKNRSSATNWRVYHSELGNTKAIFLSTTGTPDTSSVYWNNTSPTSTVFSVGSDDGVNGNGNSMVAYLFSPVAGYSNAFSYSGNGSSDGPMVHLGFRPRLIIIKRSDAADDWNMFDTARSTYNVVSHDLLANRSDAEYTGAYIDALSNGFKVRDTNSGRNASGGTYIGFAWAESPFQYARAR